MCSTVAACLLKDPRDGIPRVLADRQRRWQQQRQDMRDERGACMCSCLNAGAIATVVWLTGLLLQAEEPPLRFTFPCTVACVAVFFCLAGVAADLYSALRVESDSAARWARTRGRLPWRYSLLDQPMSLCMLAFALPYVAAVWLCRGGGFLGALTIVPLVVVQMQQQDANVERFTLALRLRAEDAGRA